MCDNHLNTENIRCLDENLDEKSIETPENQESLSNKLDKETYDRLDKDHVATYQPYFEEMKALVKIHMI